MFNKHDKLTASALTLKLIALKFTLTLNLITLKLSLTIKFLALTLTLKLVTLILKLISLTLTLNWILHFYSCHSQTVQGLACNTTKYDYLRIKRIRNFDIQCRDHWLIFSKNFLEMFSTVIFSKRNFYFGKVSFNIGNLLSSEVSEYKETLLKITLKLVYNMFS